VDCRKNPPQFCDKKCPNDAGKCCRPGVVDRNPSLGLCIQHTLMLVLDLNRHDDEADEESQEDQAIPVLEHDLSLRYNRVNLCLRSVQTASGASVHRIFFPASLLRGSYRIGTSWMCSPMRIALAVTSGQNSKRSHCRSISTRRSRRKAL